MKQSTVVNVPFYMGDTGLTVTVYLSKDGGGFAAAAGVVTELTLGWYRLTTTVGDTATLGKLAFHCTSSIGDLCTFTDEVEADVDLADLTAIKAKTDLIPAAGPADAAQFTAARAAKLDGIGGAVASVTADVNVSATSLAALRQEGLSTMFYARK